MGIEAAGPKMSGWKGQRSGTRGRCGQQLGEMRVLIGSQAGWLENTGS